MLASPCRSAMPHALMPPHPDADGPAALDDGPKPETLAALRAEIDRIDDSIHDLLMLRAGIVETLAASGAKRGTPFRPAREAQILRRLLARHRGRLPKATLVGIWRELLVGMTTIQAPFSVAVWSPAAGSGHVALAREQFGTAVPLRWMRSTAQVLRAVSLGEASVGVLPLPQDDPAGDGSADPWWISLCRGEASNLAVVARLPFVTLRPDGSPPAQSLVVAALTPEPSGDDRSLIGFEGPADLSRAALTDLVAAAGFAPRSLVTRRVERGPAACLAEVDGLVSSDDPRLAAIGGAGLARPVVIGAWPVPPPESAFALLPKDAPS